MNGCAVRPGQVGNGAYPAGLHGSNPHAASWLHQYAHRQSPGGPVADVAEADGPAADGPGWDLVWMKSRMACIRQGRLAQPAAWSTA